HTLFVDGVGKSRESRRRGRARLCYGGYLFFFFFFFFLSLQFPPAANAAGGWVTIFPFDDGVDRLLVYRRSIKIIQQHVRHQLDADDQALFIDVEFRRVDHRGDALLLVSDAEEVEEAGNDFLIVRKIFGAHLRPWRDDILLSDYFSHHRQRGFDQRGIVVSNGIVSSEFYFVACAECGCYPGQRLL